MSFRMRGQAYCAARYAATWVLIVSMSSSAVVFGAPNRRELRKAKKNCCPQPATCSPCNTCDACHSSEVIDPIMAPSSGPTPATPERAPPDPKPPSPQSPNPQAPSSKPPGPKPENQIKIEPANAVQPAPPSSSQTNPSPTNFQQEESQLETRPIIVSEEAPPKPDFPKNETPIEANSNNETPNNESNKEIAPLTVEPPKPADGGSKYQEYLNRYFDRKQTQPSDPKEEPAPELKSTPAPQQPLDEPPTLSPAKPAKEYNDPFRPTSYRKSTERTWRDSNGSSRMRARFLGVDERGMAQMQREDGRLSRVPLASFSKEDQHLIELLAIYDSTTPTQAIASRPKGR